MKFIFRESGIQITVVDANLFILFGNRNDIGHLIRMLLFPNKIRIYELFDFWFNCSHDLRTEPSLLMFDWFCARVDVKMMYSNLGIELGHVLVISSKDIYILLYELYLIFFLERWQALAYKDGLGVSFISKIYLSHFILSGWFVLFKMYVLKSI